MNFKQRIQTTLRHMLRQLGQHFPRLRRYSGRFGFGRILTRGNVREQILIDKDITIELDLSIPYYRAMYFSYNLSTIEETVLIRRLLTSRDIFVDIGAHIGYFALVAAKYAGHVWAIEPSPTIFKQLQHNIQLNSNLAPKITSLMLGLADRPGILTLYTSRSEPHNTSLKPEYVPDAVPVSVQVDTLDNILENSRASFVKIDVEGAELGVLKGAQQVIVRDHPLVVCELNVRTQRAFGHTCDEIIHFLEEHQYTAFHVQEDLKIPGRLKLEKLNPGIFSSDIVTNGLFVPYYRLTEVLEVLK